MSLDAINELDPISDWQVQEDGPEPSIRIASETVILSPQDIIAPNTIRANPRFRKTGLPRNPYMLRIGLCAVGFIMAIAGGLHFAMQGRIVYIVPAFLASLYFVLDLVGNWEERRENVAAPSAFPKSNRGWFASSHHLAGGLRFLRQ